MERTGENCLVSIQVSCSQVLRKGLLLVATLVASVLLAAPARAESVSQLKYNNYVNDFAHVLSDQTLSSLNGLCLQLDQKAHAQVAVVTINSLDGSDIESYSFALAQKWGVGVGSKSTNRGVLILFAVKDHKYRFEVSYGLEAILPDGKVGGFGREAVPLLRQGNYDGAVSLMTQRVANVIAQDAGVQLTGVSQPLPTTYHEMPRVIFILFIIFLLLATPLRRVVFWWLVFAGAPRWGGGSSHSGTGGFGGGGGFGGFGGGGGGGFGGGGASGGW